MLKYLTLTAATAVLCCLPINFIQADDPQIAHVRVLHTAPTTGPLTLTINEQPTVLPPLTYGTLTGWYTLETETYLLRFTEADTEQTLSRSLTLEHQQWITVTVIGTPQHDTLTIHTIEENYAEIAAGEARLSVFNALDGSTPVDLMSDETALLQYITYPNGQDGFVTVDLIASNYRFEITANGAPDQTLLDIDEITLRAGENMLLALTGTVDAPYLIRVSVDLHQTKAAAHPPLFAAQNTTQPSGYLRLGHFASGAPDVNLIINGEQSAVRDLPFATISPFVALPAGPQQITITYGEVQLIPTFSHEVTPDGWFTVGIIGAVENGTLTTQIFEHNMSDLPENQTRIGIFQAIPGIPPVNVQTGDSTTLIRLLGYPGSQGNNDGYETIEITAGTHDIDVITADDAGTIIADLPEINFEANHTYLITTLRADPPYIIEQTSLDTDNN